MIAALVPTLVELRSPRAQAYIVLAWDHLCRGDVADAASLENIAWCAARQLVECYERCRSPDWQWFESRMTYANAVLPHALFAASRRWPSEPFLEVAEASFSFLDRETTAEGVFWPIGNGGWHAPEQNKALHDQQPVEAATMAEAALAAFGLRHEDKYLATFRRARDWFHGQNSLRQPLADVGRGACCDGLHGVGRQSKPRRGIDARLPVDRDSRFRARACVAGQPSGGCDEQTNSLNRLPQISPRGIMQCV